MNERKGYLDYLNKYFVFDNLEKVESMGKYRLDFFKIMSVGYKNEKKHRNSIEVQRNAMLKTVDRINILVICVSEHLTVYIARVFFFFFMVLIYNFYSFYFTTERCMETAKI